MKPVPRALAPELRHSPLLRPASFDETVLVPIVEEAFRRAAELPEFTAEAAERARRSPRAVRSFAEALGAPGRRFILEVKSVSPSLGLIRESIDLNEYARVYGRFADGISVLTEPRFFNGSFERLAAMRRLTDRPLLAKDFIVDERQLLAARAAGADAVLLMLSVLSPEGYEKLAARAAELGLDVLAEVSDEAELADAAAAGARIIGINNRNLRNLTIDLGRTARLAPLVPEGCLAVSESGIRTHADIESLGRHAECFLIGSALGQADDLSEGVRTLLFGEGKCCGITRPEDALAAAEAGAGTVGIITARRSPRYVAPDAFGVLAAGIRRLTEAAGLPVRIAAVADAADAEALAALEKADFDTLQLHGDVTEDSLKALRRRFPGRRLVAAFGMNALGEAETERRIRLIDRLLDDGLIDRALLDAAVGGLTGGTGRTISTALPARFARPDRILLSGGLSPANARAAAASGAAGLDFNSGVESAPGIKSRALIADAFAQVRGNPISNHSSAGDAHAS